MPRRKRQIPEEPVIDYKKQIADKYAQMIIDEVWLNNLSQFIVHADDIINKNELGLEEVDTSINLPGMLLEMSDAIKYDNYDEAVSDIQRYFAHDLGHYEYSVGKINDMQAGLTALGLILEALREMNELAIQVNCNGKLIEVPE